MKLQLDKWQEEVLKTKGHICLISGRQTGKSTIIAIKAAKYAVQYAMKSVLIISATERQAEELFIKVLNYLYEDYKSQVKLGKDRPTKSTVKLKNHSIIRCLPTGLSGVGIRGYTIDLLIADEAAFIPEDVWAAVTPMLLTTGGNMILISTPHGKKGYFYDCYGSKDFATFHINSEENVKNRPISETWFLIQRENALKHLEREKTRMTALQYAQEYLGQFIEELRQFFPDKLIKKCMKLKRGGPAPDRDYFLGVDVARMGEDESTFEIVDRTKKNALVHVENIITRKTLTTDTTKKVIELNKLYKFRKIYVDDGGLGVAVFDQLLMEEDTRRKVIAINNASRPLDRDDTQRKRLLKEDLYNNLLRLMERREIQLLDDPEIYQSLKSVQYEYVMKEGQATRFRIYGTYTHIVEGLIRAAWCVKDKSLNIWVR